VPKKAYEPTQLVDTSRLLYDERQEYRKLGLGQNDAATIFLNDTMEKAGYNSVLGLFLEKVSRSSLEDLNTMVEKRIAEKPERELTVPDLPLFGVNRRPLINFDEDYNLTSGHGYALNTVMAKYLSCRLGVPVYKIPAILQHPQYPFMITSLDFVAVFCNPETGEFDRPVNIQCRTATHWKLDELKGQIPAAHDISCRHQMCVANLDETIIIYLCDNNEDGVVLYKVPRNEDMENKLIQMEKGFWSNHVEAEILPFPRLPSDAAERDIALYAKARLQYHKPPNILERGMPELIKEYAEYKRFADERKQAYEAAKKNLGDISFRLSQFMLDRPEAICGDVKMKWRQYKSRSLDHEALELAYPDIYNQFVTEKVKTGFEVRLKKTSTPHIADDAEAA